MKDKWQAHIADLHRKAEDKQAERDERRPSARPRPQRNTPTTRWTSRSPRRKKPSTPY
jgi:hypothetical protein